MSQKRHYDEEGFGIKIEGEQRNSSSKAVMLIGDSIRMGYCEFVKDYLQNVADVYYPEDNCRFAQNILVCLGWWADLVPDKEKVAVVHWNSGHWDIAKWHGEHRPLNDIEEYCAMLERIHNAIVRIFPNAKVIFATTTPMNPNGMPAANERTTAEIIEYNKAAVKTMNKLGAEVNDLFETAKDLTTDYYSDYCHFTKEGFSILGRQVADYIKERL